MVIKPAQDIQDIVIREHIEFLQENSQQKPLELDAAPTADEPLIEDGENGIFNNSLYIRQGATIYVVASDSQISIS